jgi:phosphatidylserine/phosphatidylglycerophosphate/cardiolipin synthase-like enzyme
MNIDALTVITGSFNFTSAAEENNAENLLLTQDAQMASRYAQNWEVHQQHSEPYTGLPGEDQSQPCERKRQ